MKHALVPAMAVLLCGLSVGEVRAQGAMARGAVWDEEGQPLPGVKVELDYQGQEPETFVRTTNEKGGWVQVGLPPGPYTITFSKEGYAPQAVQTNLTWGGLNEIPDVTLKRAAAPVVAAPDDLEIESESFEKVQETFTQAREALSAGRLDESEALYKEVLEKVPDLAEARFNLGLVYQQTQRWAAAEAEFRRVMELQPERSDSYSALAAVYDATGRSDEALAVLGEAGERFADDASFQFNLGISSLNASQTTVAQAAFQRTRELDPSRVEALFYLGILAIGGGEAQKAIDHLETYVSLSDQEPGNLTTAEKLLESLKAAGQ